MGYGRNTAQAIYWGKVQIVHSCLVNTCYIVIPMLFKTRRKIILLHAYNYDDNIENAGWRGLTTVEWEVCTRVRRCFSSSSTQCTNHAQLHTEHTHPHLPRNCRPRSISSATFIPSLINSKTFHSTHKIKSYKIKKLLKFTKKSTIHHHFINCKT